MVGEHPAPVAISRRKYPLTHWHPGADWVNILRSARIGCDLRRPRRIQELDTLAKESRMQQDALAQLRSFIGERIIGQQTLVNRLLIALLADGHLLVEGAPGLAKTRAIKVLADGIEGAFHRVQFTPDLLPADLTGTDIYRPQDGSFVFQKGPLFHNLVLADEINRAPAKVQSALLEAMAERQITVGSTTYELPRLFLVMATQNPIEQEGTYPLPEAQLDRFLMHVNIGYPDADEERGILHLNRAEADRGPHEASGSQVTQEALFAARHEVLNLHLAENLETYLIELVMATRNAGAYGDDLADWLQYGASPRATINLDRCARAHAWLAGRDYVDPADIQAVAYDVLRHRLILRFEAEAEGVTADQVIGELIARIAVP
jgi:MoxR-like ATPase